MNGFGIIKYMEYKAGFDRCFRHIWTMPTLTFVDIRILRMREREHKYVYK